MINLLFIPFLCSLISSSICSSNFNYVDHSEQKQEIEQIEKDNSYASLTSGRYYLSWGELCNPIAISVYDSLMPNIGDIYEFDYVDTLDYPNAVSCYPVSGYYYSRPYVKRMEHTSTTQYRFIMTYYNGQYADTLDTYVSLDYNSDMNAWRTNFSDQSVFTYLGYLGLKSGAYKTGNSYTLFSTIYTKLINSYDYESLLDSNYEFGVAMGEEYGYQQGYLAGLNAGNSSGYQTGYAAGYAEAANQDSTALAIFTGIVTVGLLPINVFLAMFQYEVFGINLAGLVSALLTIAIVIIIIRTITGGKNK